MSLPTVIKAGRYTVFVEAGKSITIIEDATGRANTFNMGDMAEYDSYNFSYYGPIIGISDKRVRIVSQYDHKKYLNGEKPRTYSLDFNKFCWRNIGFNLTKKQENNIEVSYMI